MWPCLVRTEDLKHWRYRVFRASLGYSIRPWFRPQTNNQLWMLACLGGLYWQSWFWGRRISRTGDQLGNIVRVTFKQTILKISISQVWWHTPVILALGRLRQKDAHLEASLGYIVGSIHFKIHDRIFAKNEVNTSLIFFFFRKPEHLYFCVCVYVYTCVHLSMCACVYVCASAFVSVYMCVKVGLCTCESMCTCGPVCICVPVSVCTCVSVCVCTCMHWLRPCACWSV